MPAKRSFIPSKWERMKVNKLIHAINKGWLKVDEEEEDPKSDEEEPLYDLWGEDAKDPRTKGKLPPALVLPKTVRPEHDESYNPPAEYLPTDKESKEWQEAHPQDRDKNYLPKKYKVLRHVEVYTDLIKERFERCLDLYLAPRVKKRKVHVDPDSLLPELPPPSSLKPFPSFANVYYKGHKHRLRAITTDPEGVYLVSGDESGLLLVFDVKTSRILKRLKFEKSVVSLDWNSDGLLLLAEGCNLHIIDLGFGSTEATENIDKIIKEAKYEHSLESGDYAEWKFYAEGDRQAKKKTEEGEDDEEQSGIDLYEEGFRVTIEHASPVSQVVYHSRGNYFASVSPKAPHNVQVLIHSFSKGKSQKPFAKSKSNIQKVLFHHAKPILFIATQQHVWVFNLKTQVKASNFFGFFRLWKRWETFCLFDSLLALELKLLPLCDIWMRPLCFLSSHFDFLFSFFVYFSNFFNFSCVF